jgi:gamma-glutamyltranspeptidase/glutathione hydrolase
MFFPKRFYAIIALTGCATLTQDQGDTITRYSPAVAERAVESFRDASESGMVVAAHPLASDAGAKILNAGGNAIDAAVAASFVISVVRPQSTGLGGGGFMLYHDAKSSHQRVFDFRERAPRLAKRDMYMDAKGGVKAIQYQGREVKDPSVNGHLSVAIPGLVKGLFETHKELGRLPLGQVMGDAIAIAENGFVIYPALAEEIEERRQWLEMYPSSRGIFFGAKGPLREGEILRQPDLARTLRAIAQDGYKVFYEGEIAKKIVAEMKSGGGIIDVADLRNYRVIERTPVKGTYRGHRVVSMPPPSSGGTHLIEMLNMLETKQVSELHPRGATFIHLLSEVMRRAFADRAMEMGDPDFVDVPVARLTSKSYARDLLKSFDSEKATDSRVFSGQKPTGESPSTTHISVVDRDGNAVATTQTVNYSFGSCVVAAGTGVVLNDEMDDFAATPGLSNVFGLTTGVKNEIAPGKTPLSSMTPTMVFHKDGKLRLVLGSPGGPRIINAVLQTIIHSIDYNRPLLDSVLATRIHHQYLPDKLRVEAQSLDPDTKKSLEEKGHQISPIESIGDVQGIERLADGTFVGVSDSRSDGMPKGARISSQKPIRSSGP